MVLVDSLTNTRKKGLDRKSSLLQDVRDCCDRYSYLFLFGVENMRNNKIKDVRSKWKDSRFFYGKNRVMQLALGRTEAEEYKNGLHLMSDVCAKAIFCSLRLCNIYLTGCYK